MDELDRLERLAKLKTDGFLTEEEFAAQKARIMAGPAQQQGTTPPPIDAAVPTIERTTSARDPIREDGLEGRPARPLPWLWLAGGLAMLLLVVFAAVLVGRDAAREDNLLAADNVTVADNLAPAQNSDRAPPSTDAEDDGTDKVAADDTAFSGNDALPAITIRDNELLYGGAPVTPRLRGDDNGPYAGLRIVRRFDLPSGRAYIVEDAGGGTACPITGYYVAEATDAGFRVTDQFGSCGELTSAVQAGGDLVIAIPDFAVPGADEADREVAAQRLYTYRYRDGVLRSRVSGPPRDGAY